MRTLALVALLLVAQAPAPPAAKPLSEVEQLRVENLQLRSALLDKEREALTRDLAKLRGDIERERPGWVWHPESGTFTAREPQP